MSNGSGGTKLVVKNRRASHDYHLDDRYEAGLALQGTEVKSLRDGRASLAEAWVKLDQNGEAWLMQCHIPEYEQGGRQNHDPTRPRKLLLHRHELRQLQRQIEQKGATLVPTRLYFRHGLAKLEFAVAHGKNVADKRRDLKEKQAQREMQRAMKHKRQGR